MSCPPTPATHKAPHPREAGVNAVAHALAQVGYGARSHGTQARLRSPRVRVATSSAKKHTRDITERVA